MVLKLLQERKHYNLRQKVWLKRCLRPQEYFTNINAEPIIPFMSKARLMNEVACLDYIAQNTTIPVPTVLGAFEDAGAYYILLSFVPGVEMAELTEDEKGVVQRELQKHIATLRALKSRRVGGPSGIVVPPYRVNLRIENECWNVPEVDGEEYGFCHNDLSQYNVLVDPESLRINAIIDWEYAGFWPEWFEMPLWKRVGPSGALEEYGEVDDTDRLIDWLKKHDVGLDEGT